MGKYVDTPCNRIVSFRVSEEELRKLKEMTYKAGISLSELMRAMINEASPYFNGQKEYQSDLRK